MKSYCPVQDKLVEFEDRLPDLPLDPPEADYYLDLEDRFRLSKTQRQRYAEIDF